jgi:hypothetical protein
LKHNPVEVFQQPLLNLEIWSSNRRKGQTNKDQCRLELSFSTKRAITSRDFEIKSSPFSRHKSKSNNEVQTRRAFVASFAKLFHHNVGGSRRRTPDEVSRALAS